jgi:flagellar hook-basal body protein
MNYGMYLSATGVLTNSYRQDVIANNLANAETVGFKRNLALFHERLAESITARQSGAPDSHGFNPLFDLMTGGLLASPTAVDTRQGELEHTGNTLDVAIQGSGYFVVQHGNDKHLTRDGRFMLDRAGSLILGTHATDGRAAATRSEREHDPLPGSDDGEARQRGREDRLEPDYVIT